MLHFWSFLTIRVLSPISNAPETWWFLRNIFLEGPWSPYFDGQVGSWFFVVLFFSCGKCMMWSNLAIFSTFLLLELTHFLPCLLCCAFPLPTPFIWGLHYWKAVFTIGLWASLCPPVSVGGTVLSREEHGLGVCRALAHSPALTPTDSVTLGGLLSEPTLSFLTYKKSKRNSMYFISLGSRLNDNRMRTVYKVLWKL